MAKFSCSLLLIVCLSILRIGYFLRKCLCRKIITYKLICMAECMKD